MSAILRDIMGACITRLGRYHITGDLGRGAMGAVFKAWDPVIDRALAIKTSACRCAAGDPACACNDRFFAEARLAGRLSHPNIVTIHDAAHDGDVAYIAMELLDGRTLREVLDAGVILGEDRILGIVIQLADALACAHAHGVVHSGVSPSTVVLLDDGRVKLVNFATAVPLSQPATPARTVVGTPKYLSPEQAVGQGLDGRSDLFSLGAVLYELLTGLPPFDGDTLEDVLKQVVESDPVPPSTRRSALSPDFDVIVAKALAKDPQRRYPSAAAMAADLRRCNLKLASGAAADSTIKEGVLMSDSNVRPEAVAPWSKRLGWAAVGAVVGIAATVLTGVAAIQVLQRAPGNGDVVAAQESAKHVAGRAAGASGARAHKRAKHRDAEQGDLASAAAGNEHRSDPSGSRRTNGGGRGEKAAPSQVALAGGGQKAGSPAQACADSANFFTREICERRQCMQAEWRDDAVCAQQRERDSRANPILTSGA